MGGLGGRGTPPAPAATERRPEGPCPLATQEPYGHRQQSEGFPFPPNRQLIVLTGPGRKERHGEAAARSRPYQTGAAGRPAGRPAAPVLLLDASIPFRALNCRNSDRREGQRSPARQGKHRPHAGQRPSRAPRRCTSPQRHADRAPCRRAGCAGHHRRPPH